MNGFLLLPLVGLLTGSAFASSTPAPAAAPSGSTAASSTPPSLSRQTSVLGKLFGISYTTSANTAQNGMTFSLGATLLGSQKSLVSASVEPSADFANGQLSIYVNGTQVSAVAGAMEQANWTDNFTFPPVNITGNIVSVPLGPVTISVDGGFSLTGHLDTDLALTLSQGQTTAPSAVEAAIDTAIQAAGFVTGAVSLWVIKAGLEGQVDAADGAVQTKADLYFAKTPPTFTATGSLGFFAGAISAFADYYALFSGWKQFWSLTLFSWKGLCFNFANGVQVNGSCPAQ